MNTSMVRYIIGNILKIEAVFLLLPCVVAIFYKESQGWNYLLVAILSGLLGFLLSLKKPKNNIFYLKEGCITTALSWIILSLVGCIPLYITNEIPNLIDAFFEIVSGFTTTGATILSDVEALSHCSLFWRCFTHWIGGMGVLVFLLAIVPMNGGSHMNLMRAESPGPTVGKLVPKLKITARILYVIYFVLTVVEFILLLIAGTPVFDALCLSIGTAGTGGFAVKNTSVADYSSAVIWIVSIFMFLFGVNFNMYYLILYGKLKKALLMEEVRAYVLIVTASIIGITISILSLYPSLGEALMHAAFQVTSIISTTGFASADYEVWPGFAKSILVILTFIGACAGSTGGGIKISRILIAIKVFIKEITSYIHPKSIKKIQMEGKPLEDDVIRATSVYFLTFILIFVCSFLLVALENKDFTTTFTAIAATLNNVGPGLEMVGPTQNFGHFNWFSKLVMSFDMIAGRLELFPLLLLFTPAIWREHFSTRIAEKKKNKH
ncbi:MAG: TrkH family potassium uptake protein [Lachnospiraceae bacterium]|nr:TrkH family potassium uptake protein [Lachnospiraceae bacterium]